MVAKRLKKNLKQRKKISIFFFFAVKWGVLWHDGCVGRRVSLRLQDSIFRKRKKIWKVSKNYGFSTLEMCVKNELCRANLGFLERCDTARIFSLKILF